MISGMKISGEIYFTKVSKSGAVEKLYRKNRVTQIGVELIIDKLLGNSTATLDILAVGSGVTANTGLESGLATQISTGPITNIIQTSSPPIGGAIQVHGKIIASTGATVTECGIFAGSTLFSRAVFSTNPIIMQPDDYLDIAWVISFNSV